MRVLISNRGGVSSRNTILVVVYFSYPMMKIRNMFAAKSCR